MTPKMEPLREDTVAPAPQLQVYKTPNTIVALRLHSTLDVRLLDFEGLPPWLSVGASKSTHSSALELFQPHDCVTLKTSGAELNFVELAPVADGHEIEK